MTTAPSRGKGELAGISAAYRRTLEISGENGFGDHLKATRRALTTARPQDVVQVIGSARSGSTIMCMLMEQLDDVAGLYEPLNPSFIAGASRLRGRAQTGRFLNRLAAAEGAGTLVMKHFHDQLATAEIDCADLEQLYPGASWFLLYRRDLLAQYTSLQMALRTDRWVSRPGASPDTSPSTIHLDPQGFMSYASAAVEADRSAWEMLVNVTAPNLVVYEDMAKDPEDFLRTHLAPLLGIAAPDVVEQGLKKQNRRPLDDTIENYAELAELPCRYHPGPC